MKILAFDIGGTAIKYSICEDDKLKVVAKDFGCAVGYHRAKLSGGETGTMSICEDDKLLNVNEIPTNAMMGARHVMDTLKGLTNTLSKDTSFDATAFTKAVVEA